MSKGITTIYGQRLPSESQLKRMTKSELVDYILELQNSYCFELEAKESCAKEYEKLCARLSQIKSLL